MNVSCSDCGSVFRVDPSKVAREGVRAKCSVCGGVIAIAAREERRSVPRSPMAAVSAIPVDTPDAEQEAEALMTPPAEILIESRVEAVTAPIDDTPPVIDETTPIIDDTIPVDEIAMEPLDHIAIEPPRGLTPVSPAPIVAPPAEPAPIAAAPAAPAPMARPALTPPVRSPTPRTTMPTAVPPATPMSGAAVGGFRPGPAGIAGAGARPAAAPVPPPTPASTVTPVSAPLAATPVSSAGVTPLFTTPVAGAETAPRRPVNPFLANDPSAKAKRLARALVSDMIAYLPQKREEGLRDGTLKQIFREEIKKSYEEYVDQIGREIAENTTHFQEALNDLLAGGQKIF